MTQLIRPVNNNDHVFGNPNAPIELVEYGDYECPYCGKAYPIVKDIQQKLGKDLKFVFRNFPLSKIHVHAFSAAVATEAAGMQQKFWEMHDIIFENQQTLELADIFQFAKTIGLNLEYFEKDLQLKSLADKVEKDFETGLRSGVNRTPSFYINGVMYEGGWSKGQLLEYLESRLTNTGVTQE